MEKIIDKTEWFSCIDKMLYYRVTKFETQLAV